MQSDGDIPESTFGHAGGPWPTCVGKSFAGCAHIIHQATALFAAHSPIQMERVKPSHVAAASGPFQHNRVRIFVNEDDVVVTPPKRG